MNKKSGTAGTPIEPVAPTKPHEADVADPGGVSEMKAEQIQTKSGKYGSTKGKPFKPPAEDAKDDSTTATSATSTAATTATDSANSPADEEKKQTWIEIELVGEDDKPIAGEKYRLTLPDNTVDEGTLDQNGWARVEGFETGDCKITFPDLDQEAWEFIKSAETKVKKSEV